MAPRWLPSLLDVVLPRACDACDRALPMGHAGCLCHDCRASITAPFPRACDVCAVPLPGPAARCADCIHLPPAFATARALGLYLPTAAGLNPLARAVHALKYHRRRAVADTLAALLATRHPVVAGALLVPVPLHLRRLRQRGFNQAALLARGVGRRHDVAVDVHLLRRRTDTVEQSTLRALERRRNLRDAFVVSHPQRIRDRDVVLVDDVVTTGATADACARALRAAGARRVDVLAVGRTPAPT